MYSCFLCSVMCKLPRCHEQDLDNSIVTTTTITVDNKGKPVTAMTEVTVPKLNKSFSEPALDKYGNPAGGRSLSSFWIVH